jgi:hypothetical protein
MSLQEHILTMRQIRYQIRVTSIYPTANEAFQCAGNGIRRVKAEAAGLIKQY